MTPLTLSPGVTLHKGHLDRERQRALVNEVRQIVQAAPLFSPLTPWGKPMRVRMTSAGDFGWYTDRRGYRYIDRHPDGIDWPPIPQSILDVWSDLTGADRRPECCLINYYDASAKMGLHQDKDEADFSYPVLSISLGDTARFRIGGTKRADPTSSFDLESGDVLILSGQGRLAYHGVDRIRAGSSDLLKQGGRLNLTLRVVT